jgi:hypothetical protein
MIIAILAVVMVLLLVSGGLAYQNSRLITQQKQGGTGIDVASLRYSVYSRPDSGQAMQLNDTSLPLFSLTVPSDHLKTPESVVTVPPERGAVKVILCRDSSGQGEMRLQEAGLYMLNRIRTAARPGVLMECEVFAEQVIEGAEKDMILSLEQATREGTNDANCHQ